MGSTNKTTNLGLSQFIGTDKPTWLVDYNNDMAVIDEAVGELQNDSGLTDNAIAELQTNVQNLQSGQGDSETEIAEIKSNVQTLSANYETMHHEVATLENNVTTVDNKVKQLDKDLPDYVRKDTLTSLLGFKTINQEITLAQGEQKTITFTAPTGMIIPTYATAVNEGITVRNMYPQNKSTEIVVDVKNIGTSSSITATLYLTCLIAK